MMASLRVSIRFKMLALMVSVLSVAMLTYLYLADSLVAEDKLAYTFDLDAALVGSLSEQTASDLEVLQESLRLFAQEVHRTALGPQTQEAAAALFARRPHVLRVQVFRAGAPEQTMALESEFVSADAELGSDPITSADLEMIRRQYPPPLDAVDVDGEDFYLQNSSLPPNLAVLTIVVPWRPRAFAKVATSGAAIGKAGEASRGGHDTAPRLVVADFRHERLLRIFGRSKIHETFLVDARGEVLAHPERAIVVGHTKLGSQPLVAEALRGTVRHGVKEFQLADGAVMLGGFAKVAAGNLMVVTQVPRDEALRATRELVRRSALFGVGILLLAFMASIVFGRLLTAPILRLRAATERMGAGNLDVKVDVTSRDEIGALAQAFNQMAADLKAKQGQLVQSEKLAAFGQLGAGITHEVKNPIGGIMGFAQLGRRAASLDEAVELFGIIEKESKRCNEILQSFLRFARPQRGDAEVLDVNELVDAAVRLFKHQLTVHGVRVLREAGTDVPRIRGSAGQLQQVLLNLAINAQHAMPNGGQLVLRTVRGESGDAVVEVSDNGTGMTEAVQHRIFEPFFTTKPVGQGSGLGLSVSFAILRDHGGSIAVRTREGDGATFTLRLPAVDVQADTDANPSPDSSPNSSTTSAGV